jgi:hypothetical protein
MPLIILLLFSTALFGGDGFKSRRGRQATELNYHFPFTRAFHFSQVDAVIPFEGCERNSLLALACPRSPLLDLVTRNSAPELYSLASSQPVLLGLPPGTPRRSG